MFMRAMCLRTIYAGSSQRRWICYNNFISSEFSFALVTILYDLV